jgi:hypothetical protein
VMATVPEQIETALFARALTLDITGDPPLAWPNIPFPDEGEDKPLTFIEVRHFPNRNTRLLLNGFGPHLRQGILQFTIYTPRNGGYDSATQLAGQIAEHFYSDLKMFEDNVKVRVQQAPDIIPAEVTEDQVSWSARVDVRYECLAAENVVSLDFSVAANSQYIPLI